MLLCVQAMRYSRLRLTSLDKLTVNTCPVLIGSNIKQTDRSVPILDEASPFYPMVA